MTVLRSVLCTLAVLLCGVPLLLHPNAALPVSPQQTAPTTSANIKAINPTFTTIDVPGGWGSVGVSGINTAGEMVGTFAKANNGENVHSFKLVDGEFTYFDYPGAYGTFAGGINDSGTIVGYAEFNGGLTALGFFYDGTTFTTYQDSHVPATFAMSLNNAGDVVGGKGDPGTTRGFQMRSGQFRNISPPGGEWVYVYATATNSSGEVVGWTAPPDAAFSYRNGRYLAIAFPGATDTEAHGINDADVIVGWYASSGYNAFAYRGGKYLSFAYPGAAGTFPSAINLAGQVVGSYTFDYQTYHGFVTSPITEKYFR